MLDTIADLEGSPSLSSVVERAIRKLYESHESVPRRRRTRSRRAI